MDQSQFVQLQTQLFTLNNHLSRQNKLLEEQARALAAIAQILNREATKNHPAPERQTEPSSQKK